jgi:hypothetical protein
VKPSSLTTTRPEVLVTRVSVVALLILCGVELAAIMLLNDRHIIYSLDDAYIHLALAENIAHGQYGVNAGELSSPASSILWPFLLAPFARWSSGQFVPLVVNLLAAAGSLVVFIRMLSRPLARFAARHDRLLVWLLIALVIPSTNVVGLVFTGMEHSLQVFLALIVLLGIIREQETGAVSWWHWAAIVVGPLVRYENLAVSLPAIVYLIARGHTRGAVTAGIGLTFALAAFSWFLHSSGLEWLPGSVLAKSAVMADGGATAIVQNLRNNLHDRQGVLLAVAWLVLLAVALDHRRSKEQRMLASWTVAALGLHLLVGAFGWYHRYEIYMWVTTLAVLLVLFAEQLSARFAAAAGRTTMLLCLIAAVIGLPYAGTLLTTPIASNNVYEQQYQMHRFLTEYWRAGAAVNDLGWASYRNDDYIVDLLGLGTRRVVESARANGNANWMDTLAKAHGVKLAAIYSESFPEIPKTWMRVGDLYLSRRRVSILSNQVTFYALDPPAAARARGLFIEFRRTLPAGTSLVVDE